MTTKSKLEKNSLVRVTPIHLFQVLTHLNDYNYLNDFKSFICELKDLKKVIDIIDAYKNKIANSRKLEDLEEMKTILKNLGIIFSLSGATISDDKKENIKCVVYNYWGTNSWMVVVYRSNWDDHLSLNEFLTRVNND